MAELSAWIGRLEIEDPPVFRIARYTDTNRYWFGAQAFTVRGHVGRVQPYGSFVISRGRLVPLFVHAPAVIVGLDVSL